MLDEWRKRAVAAEKVAQDLKTRVSDSAKQVEALKRKRAVLEDELERLNVEMERKDDLIQVKEEKIGEQDIQLAEIRRAANSLRPVSP